LGIGDLGHPCTRRFWLSVKDSTPKKWRSVALTIATRIAIWPIAVLVLVGIFFAKLKPKPEKIDTKAKVGPIPYQRGYMEPEFSVLTEHLLAPFCVDEIEERERIVDPLNAVPNLPFGHLNPAWRKFVDNLSDKDEIWEFSTSSIGVSRGDEACEGYVAVADGLIGAYVIISRKKAE
jgi:hypothetical protein